MRGGADFEGRSILDELGACLRTHLEVGSERQKAVMDHQDMGTVEGLWKK